MAADAPRHELSDLAGEIVWTTPTAQDHFMAPPNLSPHFGPAQFAAQRRTRPAQKLDHWNALVQLSAVLRVRNGHASVRQCRNVAGRQREGIFHLSANADVSIVAGGDAC
jgi:hypothetical protein